MFEDSPVARQRRNAGGTPFTNWIRTQRGLESNAEIGYVGTDLDLVWYNYKFAHLMLLEEKHGQEMYAGSQRTVQSIIDQALSFAFGHEDFTLFTPPRCKRIPPKICYHGHRVVRFERTTPEDGKVWVSGRLVSKDDFLRFLRFEWMPTRRGDA